MKKHIFFILLIGFISPFFAQDSNIFLKRDYWKSNPSITDIEKNIAEGHDVVALNRFGFDAVSYALIENVETKTVKYLLTKKGNDVNKLTHDGRTYIFWAAYKNNLELMDFLVRQGAKTDIIDDHGNTVLNFAAVTGQTNIKLYDFLIQHGANPLLEKNHDGANALLLVAPFLEDPNMINYFASKGLDVHSTDDYGNGLFSYAAKGGNIKMLDQLIAKGFVNGKTSDKAMIFASQGTRGKKNGLEVYKYLEKKGISINATDHKGRNPLHAIAYDREDVETFEYFINNGVDINQPDDDGNSPFMNAANGNALKIIEFLSTYVKDINAQDKIGRSALAKAVNRNSPEVVTFLIKKGADVQVLDNDGNSLMYYLIKAYRSNASEVFNSNLKTLKEAGLDINKTQGKGKTLYHLAVEKDNLDVLKRIQDFGIDVNQKDDNGLTPLHLSAMKAKDERILKYLISIGADKTINTDFEESVYDLANENELLQNNNININFLK